jgi:protein-ribulosamine 3-kinase
MKRLWREIAGKADLPTIYLGGQAVGGGCINDAWKVESSDGLYFVKRNKPEFAQAFEVEAAALEEIAATRTVRVPNPVAHGTACGEAFLVLEYIDMQPAQPWSHSKAGEQLAALHCKTSQNFGWKYDNTIGATPQPNPWTDSWVSFYRDHRLENQFKLARERSGKTFQGKDKLLANLDTFFKTYNPLPSLLHGDLWGGNIGFDGRGNPVLFDPSTYYGDREADIAFTEMFGGFRQEFYASYNEAWPLDPVYPIRKDLYNLYHYLNHHNLFGGGYAETAQSLIDQLLHWL